MIHPGLRDSLSRLEAHFLADKRCAAMYLWGSLGNETADSFSDVDAAVVVHDANYQAVKSELRSVCETLCGPILAWLPEGERPETCNFAFLFAYGDEVLLYDLYLSSAAAARQGPGSAPKRLIFDRAGLFETAQPAPVDSGAPRTALGQDITNYWVYMYLNGKYFRRNDAFKMRYVQDVLFHTHLKVLLARHGRQSAGWWARDIHQLPDDHQKQLSVYFAAAEAHAIARAILQEVELFGADARAACAQFNLEYPHDLEEGVRRHLRRMAVN